MEPSEGKTSEILAFKNPPQEFSTKSSPFKQITGYRFDPAVGNKVISKKQNEDGKKQIFNGINESSEEIKLELSEGDSSKGNARIKGMGGDSIENVKIEEVKKDNAKIVENTDSPINAVILPAVDMVPKVNKVEQEVRKYNDKGFCLADYDTYCRIGNDKAPISIEEAERMHYFFTDVLRGKKGTIKQLHFNPDKNEARKIYEVCTDNKEFLILKIIRYNPSEVKKDYIMNEYKICLKNSKCPYIPRLYKENPMGFYEADEYCCFEVLFYYEGKSLYSILKDTIKAKETLKGKVLYDWGLKMAEAFAELHKLSIFHSDVKPENIVFNEGKIVVIDYGAAREDANLSMMTIRVKDDITACTSRYMAPEFNEFLHRSDMNLRYFDIFSWGVSMYQLCTSMTNVDLEVLMGNMRNSFTHHTELYQAIEKLNFPDLSEIENKTLKATIRSSVSYTPEGRHPFDEIAESLKKREPFIHEKVPFYKTKWFIISAVLSTLAIIAVIVVCVLFTRSNSSQSKIQWKLVWTEDFNSLSTEIWNIETSAMSWVKVFESTFDQKNVILSEGIINLLGTKNGNGSYSAAAISTRGKKTFRQGKLEASIRIPGGSGFQTNLLLVATGSNCTDCATIYMLINYGQMPTIIQSFVYGEDDSHNPPGAMSNYYAKPFEEYTNYAVEFVGDEVTFYINGNSVYTKTKNIKDGDPAWPIGKYDFYIYANMVVGRQSSPYVDRYNISISPTTATKFPGIMSIDYIKFYEPIIQ